MDLPELDPVYVWLVIGLMLAVAEMAIPGVFLIWMAGAALLTAGAVWAMPLDVPVQVILFAVLSVGAVFAGRRYVADHPLLSPDPKLNRLGQRMVGETVVVSQAIEHGAGRVRHGDSEWPAKGADAPVGTRLTVAATDGLSLVVEPMDGSGHGLPPPA